jgi:RND family efflux transporter MFP subunit
MSSPTDVRKQLQSLTIPQGQRPQSGAAGVGGMGGKGVLVFAVVLITAAALAYGGWRKYGGGGGASTSQKTLEFLTVATRREPTASPLLTATGKIVSDHEVQVATKVSGQVVALMFEQGDHVEEGKLLARIEDVLYRSRRDEAAAELQRAVANFEFQEINYQRVLGLVERDSAPPIEFANARRAHLEAKAQVAAGRAALDFAQKALTDCEVVAPIAGVILERSVEVGDFVAAEGGLGANANARFASIADMETLRVEVDISELDIARIAKNLPCTVTPDAYKDRLYRGYVMWIDPGANYSKATVQVKVRIEVPDEYLRVQGSAQVSFLTENTKVSANQSAVAIWIPRAACKLDASGQGGTVFVRAGQTIRASRISVGRESDSHLQVTAGLAVGDSIVAADVTNLVDGQSVKP